MPILPKAANSEGNNQTMDDRSPIPAGDYLAQIIKTEIKPTKAGTGHRLLITWRVIEGEYEGRQVFSGLNIDNPNKVAVEISEKELNSICQACGVEDVEDSDELLEIPCWITVAIESGNPQYPARNEIKGYAPESEGPEEKPETEAEPETAEEPAEEAPAGEGEAKQKLPWE